jgi:hypothetical protein
MKLANKKKYINRHLNLRNVFRGFKLLFVVSTLLFLMLIKIKNKITDNKTQQMNRVVKILEIYFLPLKQNITMSTCLVIKTN